jgi:hypothetical protein
MRGLQSTDMHLHRWRTLSLWRRCQGHYAVLDETEPSGQSLGIVKA